MKPFCVSLKAGERIFVNGAVLRVDRKVSIEFLNDVTFLLEAHIMQPEETTTPLRQLYFIIQTMAIDPANAEDAKRLFDKSCRDLSDAAPLADLHKALSEARQFVSVKRYFDALKTVRNCFTIEAQILGAKAIAEPEPCK